MKADREVYCDCGHTLDDHRGHGHIVGSPEPVHCQLSCGCLGFVRTMHGRELIKYGAMRAREAEIIDEEIWHQAEMERKALREWVRRASIWLTGAASQHNGDMKQCRLCAFAEGEALLKRKPKDG